MQQSLRHLLAALVFLIAALPGSAQEPTAAPPMDHAAMGHDPAQAMDDMLMLTREASGTAWLPDLSPMAALHASAGSWALMLHGNGFLQFIHEGGERGADQFGSINWVMGMARRRVRGGVFGLRAMLSAEPATIGGCGYPNLLATGETCDGAPLHDVQHQHDLFMEVAAEYQRPLASGLDLQLYTALVGEPALGPVAFPHRWSAMPNPIAPISHHWFDGTHIAFGVLTAGLYGDRWKVEGSLFNGREPDEERTDLDLAALDSYSGRVWWLPNERWALQLSGGTMNEAEPGHSPGDARIDMTRYVASATYHERIGEGLGLWATTAAAGHSIEEGTGTNAALLESSVNLRERHTFFGRVEWAQKSGHALGIDTPPLDDEEFNLGALALGYTLHLPAFHQLLPGVGARASLSFVSEDLEPYYGARTPMGFTLFVTLRPAEAPMEGMAMPGMSMPGMAAGGSEP